MKADLHIHTNYSDGKLKPKEVLELAKKKELDVICITDHDSIEGTEAMLKYNGRHGIEIIPGIELSADFHGREIHILGYFIDVENAALKEHLRLIKNLRLRRIRKITEKLKEFGIRLDSETIIEKYKTSSSVGRPHIANELVERGYVKDFQSAFQRYIGDNKPAHVKKENLNYEIILELIRISGGLSFTAHPGNYFRESALNELRNAGIDGVEVRHPSHTENHVKKFTAFAMEHGLLVSGGSDFHGFADYDYNNIGRYFIGSEELESIRKKLKTLKKAK